jgi:hypothetical protein
VLTSLLHLGRLGRVGFVLAREGALGLVDTGELPPAARGAIRIARLIERRGAGDGAARLAAALTRLGPSYVKFGQFLATRPDVVGVRVARDLEGLQDRMPPFPRSEAVATIEATLGKPLDAVFASFGEPVAAASIAQVHRATVRTADGERFIPNFIENRLKFSPYIRNVAVIGAGREQLTAIICIDFDAVGHWAEERRISYASYADLSQNPQVQGLVASVVTHINKLQPPGLRIRRFVNLHKDFDADDGEITRTRKLRRNTIETTYASLIAALYGSERETVFDAAITYESGERGVIRRTLTISEVPV